MKNQTLNFLKNNQLMSLATVGKNNLPQNSILLYTVDEDFNLYFATDKTSRKFENLQYNPAVAITIWKNNNRSLQIEGKVSIVENANDVSVILTKLAEAAVSEDPSLLPPIIRINRKADTVIFRIKVKQIRSLDLKNPTIKENESPITIIEF